METEEKIGNIHLFSLLVVNCWPGGLIFFSGPGRWEGLTISVWSTLSMVNNWYSKLVTCHGNINIMEIFYTINATLDAG